MSTVFRVQKNANYTTMSNYHLKDRRLSYKAKGLLSVILSLPDEWDYSLKGLSYISDDGIDSVRSTVKELEKFGYISRGAQTRDERGRMSANEYFVFENPEQNLHFKPNSTASENPTRSENEKNDVSEGEKITAWENPTRSEISPLAALEFPTTDNPMTENPTAATYYNNKILNNQLLNNQSNQSIRPSPPEKFSEDRIDRTDVHEKNYFSFSSLKEKSADREKYRELILRNIEYECFPEDKKPRVDEFVEIMLDEICGNKATIRANGAEMPLEVVKSRFLKLNYEHIEYVLDELRRCAPDMRNPRAYLITTLYNAPATIDNRYAVMADHDIAAGII